MRQTAETLLTCPCGNVFDLTRFAAGEAFACPVCNQGHVVPGVVATQAALGAGTGTAVGANLRRSTMTVHSGSGGDNRKTDRISLPQGTRLGRFLLDGELGRGGMGVVYLARDLDLDRHVALKLLPHDVATDPRMRDGFRREAQAAAKLLHPNVAVIYSIESAGEALFFTMEYVRGVTLAEHVEQHGPFDASRALEIVLAVADGLRTAHQHGIIHRDIKPSNIMLDEQGRPKITDFGLAKVAGVGMDVGKRGAVLGTPYYMSPEQGTGRTVDHRSDMYSLGVTLFEMLSGRPPFEGANPIDIILAHTKEPLPPLNTVPYPAEALIRRLTRKDPSSRPASYENLSDEVQQALAMLKSGTHAILDAGRSSTDRSTDTMLRTQIALARTNLEMGRYDKAEKIFKKLLREKGRMRVEGALLLGDLYERQGNLEQAAEQWQLVMDESENPTEVAFARWKIGNTFEQRAASLNEQAVSVYREIMTDDSSPFPRRLLEARIQHLEEGIAALRREISSSSVRLQRER